MRMVEGIYRNNPVADYFNEVLAESLRNIIAAARDALLPSGQYGSRVSVHQVPYMDLIPLVSDSADLVVADSAAQGIA